MGRAGDQDLARKATLDAMRQMGHWQTAEAKDADSFLAYLGLKGFKIVALSKRDYDRAAKYVADPERIS
jgi:hypothetical protein